MAEKKQFLLRIDKKVFEALEKWAGDEFRSVNSHIEFVLREALVKSGRGRYLKDSGEKEE